MSLKYTCPSCGTPLGYEGLCWKCKCEQERQAALAWMPEQIVEKQRNLIQNIQRLADMEDPEFADFWQLLGYHDAITPEIQRVALAAEVFWPCEIYYHAPADVRDGLIHALLSAEYSSAASNLMSCLAMQGDDKAMETLLELERNPRPWRKGLYVDPSSYAQIGGWTFDKEGQKIQLNFDTCYPMVKGTAGEKSPVRIGRAREDTCPHCGGRMVDMLVLPLTVLPWMAEWKSFPPSSLTGRRRRIAMSVPRTTRPSRKIPLCWAKRLCPCFTARPARM